MNGMCRRQVKRLLKGQRSKFQKACRKQSRHAAKVVQRYLDSRRPWNRVDKLVSQAEEAERILLRLRSDGVPIPEDRLASVVKAKEKHSQERASITESTLSAVDFEFVVPSDLGVPNLDQFDFCSEVSYEEEEEEYWARSSDEEDRGEEDSATEGEEEEDEEEEEEDEEEEEEEVPLLTKGVVSGVRLATEIPQPVAEVGGTSQDAREGGEEDRPAATAVRSELQSGVENVSVVPTAPGNATEVVRPLGDLSDEVPPVGEKTPREDLLGGNESEEVPHVGEEAPLAAEGAPADVQPESGTRVEGEKTVPAAEGATSGVPEEGDQGRVQLEGDVSPPEVEE